MNEDYFRIRINSIHPAQPVPFDIYIYINGKYIHYLRDGDSITKEKLKKFESKAPESFFILYEHKGKYKDYVHDLIESDKVSPQEKALILRESSIALVEELFESPNVEKALNDSKVIISDFINFMGEEPEGMADLIGLSSHDFYTYNHSLDVSIYALGLGQVVGYSKEDLKVLGEGSLFHDIGKRNVSADIICKAGPLDENEWAEMQKHPEFGLAILNQYDVSDAIKACCFEHHESFTGNGYPQKLHADEIHPMARIVAITDTYDALTTKRTYNQPMSPEKALKFIKNKLISRFDPDLVNAMYSVLFQL
ncbi:MAG: HD domain-containing protein [Bdellovibrionaceae bacterium]|nr:HD domain-containing protein [Pseudobdellovibrionaceae bacterium]